MRKWLCFAFILAFAIVVQAQKPLLLHQPAVSASQLVFSYGDDLWSAPREGGAAHPLTTGPGAKSDAAISPDGPRISILRRMPRRTRSKKYSATAASSESGSVLPISIFITRS